MASKSVRKMVPRSRRNCPILSPENGSKIKPDSDPRYGGGAGKIAPESGFKIGSESGSKQSRIAVPGLGKEPPVPALGGVSTCLQPALLNPRLPCACPTKCMRNLNSVTQFNKTYRSTVLLTTSASRTKCRVAY